jgi:hypothetical protein
VRRRRPRLGFNAPNEKDDRCAQKAKRGHVAKIVHIGINRCLLVQEILHDGVTAQFGQLRNGMQGYQAMNLRPGPLKQQATIQVVS